MKKLLFVVVIVFISGITHEASAVYSCGGVEDTCPCGANNPYPCCSNGGNCTWYAWHSACCEWDAALPGWGNANTWAQYANDNPNYEVLDYAVVGSIACRTLGTYGHVAFVTDVSGGNVTVSEENCCTTCAAGVRSWTYAESYFDAGYIVPAGGITPPACSIEINGTTVIIDDQTDCFEQHGTYWWDETTGNANHAYYTYATDDLAPDSWAIWRFNVITAGNYEVSVLVPASATELSQNSVFTVAHSGGETPVSVNQATNEDQWVILGEFWLNEGTTQYVKLTDNTGEAYALRRVLMFDAVGVAPVAVCANDCDVLDSVECNGDDGYRTCGDFDGDECLEWSTIKFCGTDETCADGTCVFNAQSCDDECVDDGAYTCETPTSHMRCGHWDGDPCLDYGGFEECTGTQICNEGVCVDSSDSTPDSPSDDGCNCKNTGKTGKNNNYPLFIILFGLIILGIKKRK
jgi:CHAP domain